MNTGDSVCQAMSIASHRPIHRVEGCCQCVRSSKGYVVLHNCSTRPKPQAETQQHSIHRHYEAVLSLVLELADFSVIGSDNAFFVCSAFASCSSSGGGNSKSTNQGDW